MSPYDRTLCPGTDCPLRDGCYRFRAAPLARQDFFGRAPYDPALGACEHRMDLDALRPTEAQIRDSAYVLWLSEGKPEGRADAHWNAARQTLLDRFESDLRPIATEDGTP